MCSTIQPGYFPGLTGRKYSQCTVLLFSSAVFTGEGNVTSETVTSPIHCGCGVCSKVNVRSSNRNGSGTACTSSTAGSKWTDPLRAVNSAAVMGQALNA